MVGERLEHAEDVGAPLRLVGADGARRVQNARGNHPAGARLQAIGAGEIQNAVVALVPVFQALANLLFGRARLEAHKGVVEAVLGGVELRGIVVRFRLTVLPGQLGVLVHLVHVVGQGAEIVEELGEDRPALVLIPNGVANDGAFSLGDGVAEQESFAGDADIAKPFVFGATGVVGLGRAGEPALVDTASVEPQRVPIGLGELNAAPRLAEDARNPVRGQTEKTGAFFHRLRQ